MANTGLNDAKRAKNDEFYTQLADIAEEVKHYREHFRGKTVLCNCDDPRVSNFFHYFSHQFEALGLKRLITTCYKNQDMDLFTRNTSERAIWLEYFGDKNGNRIPDPEEIGIHELKGDGDFRSPECVELLKQADIVVTNPPFSLFREYVAQLVKLEKRFLIIGNKNLITKKEIFPLFTQNKMWLGVTPMSRDLLFELPLESANALIATGKAGSKYRIVGGKVFGRSPSIWYTNLDHKKRHEEILLFRSYSSEAYPQYCNFDGIEVARTEDIPCDYHGFMGVPITFMDKYNPDQFEIAGVSSWMANPLPEIRQWYLDHPRERHVRTGGDAFYYWKSNGDLVRTYDRIVIRRRKQA